MTKMNWDKAASKDKWSSSPKEFVKPHTLEKYEKKQTRALKNKIAKYKKAKHKASKASDAKSMELIDLAIGRLKVGIRLKQSHRDAFNQYSPPTKKKKRRKRKKVLSGREQYDAYINKLEAENVSS